MAAREHTYESRQFAEELARHKHPEDPRVVVTNERRLFRPGDYQAIILQRYQNPEKSGLHRTFSQMARAEKSPLRTLNMRTIAHVDGYGRVNMEVPETFLPVKSEFHHMARTYCRMTGIQEMEVLLIPDPTFEIHAHKYPVLNSSWLWNGTIWLNEAGKELQVREGDMFFFKDGLPHMSSRQPDEIRLTNIVRPFHEPT